MKITRAALSAMIAGACITGQAFAQQTRTSYAGYSGYSVSYADDEASPSDNATKPAPVASGTGCCDNACDSGCDSGWKFRRNRFACDGNGCGACDGCDGCGYGAGLGAGGGLLGGLFCNWNFGGWTNVGYHSMANAGSFLGAPANFNDYDGRVQLQQQWFYAEKVADGSRGLGLGGRIDYLYGTDGPDTQAFGIPDNHWDNPWDNGGAYGHAIPQLYGEVALGDLSTKFGKFFTIIGNEVVQATGNFFYSRQFTFYNAEPFTHTGALSTYKWSENTELYGGYVQGWDSGFKDNGDAYIGGFKRTLFTGQTLIGTSALGRFSDHPALQERGRIYSGILTTPLSDKLTHIVQGDYLFTNDAANVGVRNTFGLINYLIYNINSKWGFGQRLEWFNVSSETGLIRNADIYNYTAGFNYRPRSNLVFRPEVRWVWDKENLGVNEQFNSASTIFGADMVLTY